MKSKKLLLFAVAAAFAVATLPAAAQLSATYANTGEVSCVTSPSGFSADLIPLGTVFVGSSAPHGTFTFNAHNKTATANVINVGLNDTVGGEYSGTAVSSFTYTVASGGVLTLVPVGTVTGTFLTGSNVGGTDSVVDVPSLTGQIALNGTIVLTTLTTGVETITLRNSSGTVLSTNPRICYRTYVLVPVHDRIEE
jgi:hypothetical protein